jgi:WD40 repeat protein
LYSLLQTTNLTSYCPEGGYLYTVEWSPTRPCVFACASHQGNIHIYDLLGTKTSSAEIIKASDGPIYSLSFNAQRPGYLASGDKSGVIKIWRLSQELTKQDPDELKRLNDISDKQFQKN